VKNIEHVASIDETGCGIAAMAMVCGISYFEMKEKLGHILPYYRDKSMEVTSLGLYSDEVYAILRTHFGIRCRGVKFIAPMKNHCILYIATTDLQRTGHAVVWDAKSQKILDPGCGSITNLDNFNIYFCIEILPSQSGLSVEERGEERYYRFNDVGPRVRLTVDNKLEYILIDLLMTPQERILLSKEERIDRITHAVGLTELQVKSKLRQFTG
jgi:hypothetical protein